MIGLVVAAVSAALFGGMYAVGVVEARADLKRSGQWVEPPAPLPPARIRRRRWW